MSSFALLYYLSVTVRRKVDMEDDHHHKPIELAEALLLLETTEEVHHFLKDLCTPQEITALKERWRVCQHLEAGNLSYRDIHSLTKASLTTIGRVARFLKDEPYHGYRLILNRIKKNETRITSNNPTVYNP